MMFTFDIQSFLVKSLSLLIRFRESKRTFFKKKNIPYETVQENFGTRIVTILKYIEY